MRQEEDGAVLTFSDGIRTLSIKVPAYEVLHQGDLPIPAFGGLISRQNAGSEYVGICDSMIAAKNQADQHTALTDELNKFKQEAEARQAEVVAAQAKELAQQALTDAVVALPYDQKTKDALLKKGQAITDAAQVTEFIEQEKAFVDSLVVVVGKLDNLGFQTQANLKSETVTGLNALLTSGAKLKLSFTSKNYESNGVVFQFYINDENKFFYNALPNELWSEGYGFDSPILRASNIYITTRTIFQGFVDLDTLL